MPLKVNELRISWEKHNQTIYETLILLYEVLVKPNPSLDSQLLPVKPVEGFTKGGHHVVYGESPPVYQVVEPVLLHRQLKSQQQGQVVD